MEAPQLRPLGVGDIVDRVFALYRSRPLLYLAAAAVPYLVFVLLIAGVTIALAESFAGLAQFANALATGTTPDPAVFAGALGTFFVFILFVAIAAVVILSLQTTALVHAMSARYLGRQITLGETLRAGLRSCPRVIATGLLIFVGLILLWIVLVIAMVLYQQAWFVAIVALAGLIGTFFIFSSSLVAPVIATLEPVGPIAAIRRSFSLSKGNRWRILGLQLLLLVINGVISAIVSAVFVTTIISDAGLRTAAQQVVNALTTIAWAPVEWGTFAILYYDLRVRREAFDLQLAAEALPRTF
ncbi:MAG: hypothetical protein M3R54_04790 [Chloroflexota bacterium]|nr:hypothetical protein [Chloroflexota bacterium]